MTREQALALHNPFQSKNCFEINCKEQPPNSSLLEGRESVWLIFPNQDWVDAAARSHSLKAIFIDRPRARSLNLTPLSRLELYNFSTSYPSGVKDWSFLSAVPSLRRVALHNTLSIQSIEPLAGLLNLEVLMLSGGYSSALRLPSLSPLSGLKKLRAIFFAAVRFESWNLDPLASLHDLECFDAPLWCPKPEIAKLARRVPRITSNLFSS